ncbi:histidine kinase [Paenibacillus sp. IHB B 3415]|uniref:HAMP domain-containing sensor histidine kinase n=1 Tax=Paenibacillus sp. IHB B 3415 TaxID=867080 RepID=UPI00057544CD|nr:HAMP domain-containing sensor histidine kinase [Paenibacillus sp. IHB B 3415]KHL97133.1 histidine kinase [Paenibacillus sp. IHB B 3415]
MKQRIFFRQYMLVHFLILVLLPLMILVMVFGVYPSPDPKNIDTLNQYRDIVILIVLIIVVFIFISGVFFHRLRQRLIRLQKAMSLSTEGVNLPHPVPTRTAGMDEIAQLEASFNQMVRQLEESRLREKEEGVLRQQLIADLSHDLRTPLTALRGHASKLRKEALGREGFDSLEAIDHTITHVGKLMDDLLAYTLLTSGKYPYHPARTNMVRFVRSSIASWYPAFEDAGFHIHVDMPKEATFSWEIDPQWMTRVLDNLFQNVLRHAGDGRYIAIAVDATLDRLMIKDHGPGMDQSSANRGAGIGLGISMYMLSEMKLQARFVSDTDGTSVWIEKLDQT